MLVALKTLKASPINESFMRSPKRKSLVSRMSSELNGLKKLMFAGTLSIGPPALHGAGAGQAGNPFHSLITALSWLLFLISRPRALRERIGSREVIPGR